MCPSRFHSIMAVHLTPDLFFALLGLHTRRLGRRTSWRRRPPSRGLSSYVRWRGRGRRGAGGDGFPAGPRASLKGGGPEIINPPDAVARLTNEQRAQLRARSNHRGTCSRPHPRWRSAAPSQGPPSLHHDACAQLARSGASGANTGTGRSSSTEPSTSTPSPFFATPPSVLLHLTPAAVNAFYATMFVPSAFEAVYALLSDRLPWRGERRRPYFVALVQALSTLFLARAKTRHSALVSAVVLSAAVANGCVADVARGTQSGVSGGAASALEALRWGGRNGPCRRAAWRVG